MNRENSPMRKALNREEIELLKQFRLSTEVKPSNLSIPINKLLDETTLLQYMKKVGSHIGAPNSKVAASIFVKRYAFLVVIYLYAITAWNKKLDVSFNNVIFQGEEEADIWLPTFYFQSTIVEEAKENRNDWRAEALKELFSENIHILIDQLSIVTKQSKIVLWENIAIYIFWLYETVLTKLEDEKLQNRAKQDFHFLIHVAPGSIFGNDQTNPIKRFYANKRYIDHLQAEVRVRTSCCFSYLLKDQTKHCKTCPKKYNVKY